MQKNNKKLFEVASGKLRNKTIISVIMCLTMVIVISAPAIFAFSGSSATLLNIFGTETKVDSESLDVTFEDWDGSIICAQKIPHGGSATVPDNPQRGGWVFTGWRLSEKEYIPQIPYHTVTFNISPTAGTLDGGLTQISIEVQHGNTIPQHAVPRVNINPGFLHIGWIESGGWNFVSLDSYVISGQISFTAVMFTFEGGRLSSRSEHMERVDSISLEPDWNDVGLIAPDNFDAFKNITSHMRAVAQYDRVVYSVTFVNWDGSVIFTQQVYHEDGATAPKNPQREGWVFTGWDKPFIRITSDITVAAQFNENPPTSPSPNPQPPNPQPPNPQPPNPQHPNPQHPNPPSPIDFDELDAPLIPFSPNHYLYLIGDTDGLIRPTDNITRAEIATIFFRLITDDLREQMWVQSNPYPDIMQRNWFNNAVSTMTNIGILHGMPNGTFEPNRAITRAEFATVVSRFIERDYTGEDYFRDITGHWAQTYINTIGSLGWVIGVGNGNYEPNREITRAEAAAIVNRLLVRHLATGADLLPGMITWPDNADTTAWFYLDLQEATNSNSYEMKDDGYHKTWIELISDPNWLALERLDSMPRDHLAIIG